MTLSIERADRRMGLASDRTVYSSKRNRPLLLYGRLLDDSRPSHGLTATKVPLSIVFASVMETVGEASFERLSQDSAWSMVGTKAPPRTIMENISL